MTTNEKLTHIIRNKNVSELKKFLKEEKTNYFGNASVILTHVSEFGKNDMLKILLNDERFDPSIFNNNALLIAVVKNNFETVKLLLSDHRVDPTDKFNYAIRTAANQNESIFNLLWNDSRVFNSLKKNNANLYNLFKSKDKLKAF